MIETLITLIYFGMTPVLTLAAIIVHKLGYVDMIEEFGGDNIAIVYPLIMLFWPLVLFGFVVLGIVYVVFLALNAIADLIIGIVVREKNDDL